MINEVRTDEQVIRLQLLDTLVYTVEELGKLTVIEAIRQILKMQAEEDVCCVRCQRKTEWLHREMSLLLARYEREFLERDAVERINHRGAELVQ